jgi:hypothetical protein
MKKKRIQTPTVRVESSKDIRKQKASKEPALLQIDELE